MTTQAALSIGGTLGFTLSNTSTALFTTNSLMKKIIFHNPGTVTLYVCQTLDVNGNALTAGPNPGNWAIFSGGWLELSGDGIASASWLGAAASAGSNPLTVGVSETL
jgi:hypothetical protein